MKLISKMAASLVGFLLLSLTGCSTTQPVAYSNLSSSSALQSNPQKDDTKMPYLYTSSINWNNYSEVLLEPVVVYRGADHQFGNMSDADKQELANYMDNTFQKSLSKRFKIVSQPDAHALKLRLTLTGADTNTMLASTFTRIDLVGMPYNVVQSARGKEGMLMGSVSYSVEIYDARSNKLLKAFVTKQYPNAMNIVATFGSLAAAKTGIDKGADDLLAQMK